MSKLACITLDLEPDHAGRIKAFPIKWKKQQIVQLLLLLQKYHVKLSIFVVASLLEQHSEVVYVFDKFGAEFHLHSYSHSVTAPDSEYEILRGVKAFYNRFKYQPLGYRAPEGRISHSGMVLLKKHGFLFDSSVFPSFWPNVKYLFYPTGEYKNALEIIEIPNTVVSPFRLIFSLSWIKLFGWSFYQKLISRYGLPGRVVFGYHLHDLWTSSVFDRLPFFWKKIYQKNQSSGLDYLENVLRLLSSRGYKFTTLGSIAKQLDRTP
jgi:peptidoglycan/xylan/chitin deacetylase (PgdA/CDA1 family)